MVENIESMLGKNVLIGKDDGHIVEAKIVALSPSRTYAKVEFVGKNSSEWIGCCGFNGLNILEVLEIPH